MGKTDDTFAIRLLRAQASKNLTQAQLATALDTRASVVCAMQQGKTLPSYRTLVKLAEVLEVSTDYLCGLTP